MGHSHSTQIAVHEIGHQLSATHANAECPCRKTISYWHWPCMCRRTKCVKRVCTVMNPNLYSDTGDVIELRFSDRNKELIRSVAGFANNVNDNMAWKHCGKEGESCE